MKILFVNKLPPDFQGGAELRIKEIGKRLVEKGHKVYVLCGKNDINLPPEEGLFGMEIFNKKIVPDILLPFFNPSSKTLQALFYLVSPFYIYSFVKKRKIDIIRDSMSPFPAISFFCLLDKNVPKVVLLHELFFNLKEWIKYYGILMGPFGYIAEKLLKRNFFNYKFIMTDGVWLTSHLAFYLKGKVLHIPNGVDFKKFVTKRNRILTKNGKIIFLNVGRFVKHKDHITLINAFKLLTNKHQEVELHLVGDGPLFGEIKRKITELDLERNVKLFGRVDGRFICSYYRKSDIFVIPSLIEGMPNTLLEAMASGIPIVSSRIPAITGVLNDTQCIFFQAGDKIDLFRKMEYLLNNLELYPVLSKRIKKIAKERYDWDHVCNQELYVYRNAL